MKESVQAALSWIRSHQPELGVDENLVAERDIHVHVPAGAIPKDGPSAGVTMVTALVSSLTRIPVRRDVAMTGEITLRGKVLPIGGLKEKMLAAIRAGITTVIIPEQNRKDLEDIPRPILKKVTVVPARTIDEVLRVALEQYPPSRPAAAETRSGQKKATRRTLLPPGKRPVAGGKA
jgi:ATP-dependent Lon protease